MLEIKLIISLNMLLLSASCSVAELCPTLCDTTNCSIPNFPVLHYLLGFVQTHVHWWCHPTILSSVTPLSSCPQSFPASVFSNESALHIRWSKFWHFSISPSIEYSELISFRIDWFDLLAVQGSLRTHVQQNNLRASVLWGSVFFMVQFSATIHDYWKSHSIDYTTFVGKMMSLLFNMLSRFGIAFLPRSKHLLISWEQSPSPVIVEPKKIKSATLSTFPLLSAMKWSDQMPWC